MNNNARNGGIGFFGAMTITFIVMKLCGVIDWSWIWIVAPIWIPIACVGVMAIYMAGKYR